MKKTANSNIYAYTQAACWESYAPLLSGCEQPAVCVFSCAALSEQARQALEKSFERLGYGEDACAFVFLGDDAAPGAGAPGAALDAAPGSGVSGAGALGAGELFALTEGLDPLVLVAADAASAEALAGAYRKPLPLQRCTRLFGRLVLAYESFEALLGSEDGKQRAWALLKQAKPD